MTTTILLCLACVGLFWFAYQMYSDSCYWHQMSIDANDRNAKQSVNLETVRKAWEQVVIEQAKLSHQLNLMGIGCRALIHAMKDSDAELLRLTRQVAEQSRLILLPQAQREAQNRASVDYVGFYGTVAMVDQIEDLRTCTGPRLTGQADDLTDRYAVSVALSEAGVRA